MTDLTPERVQQTLTLLEMMAEMNKGQLAFLTGYMAAKDVDLGIKAFAALMTTDIGGK